MCAPGARRGRTPTGAASRGSRILRRGTGRGSGRPAASCPSGRSRGSWIDSAEAITSTSPRQPLRSAASTIRPSRGSEREPGELPSQWGEPSAGFPRSRVDGAELVEQGDPVADRPRVGRVEEGERLDVAQIHRRHLQDHRGEIGAQDLGLGELGTPLRSRLRRRGGCTRRAPAVRSDRPAGWPTPARSARWEAAAPWCAG